MIRSDFSWALSAVLPHAGKGKPFTDVVGLTTLGGYAYVFATDSYTSGIARVETFADLELDVRLTPKEATELERFVRPSYRDEESGVLSFATRELELHVGLERQIHRDGTTENDTAVFDTFNAAVKPDVINLTLEFLLGIVETYYAKPVALDGLIFQAPFAAKFAKAQRADFERMKLYPRKTSRSGAAVVTVGSDFVGLISGLTDNPEDATVASFLSALEGKAA